jgi:hypothetical protein
MRIIYNHSISAFAGGRATHPERDAMTRFVILEFCFLVLVRCQRESILPPLPVPRTFQQAPAFDRIPDCQRRGVATIQPAQLWMRDPLPARPQHRNQQRLHMSRRHTNQQPPDLTATDRLQVIANSVDMPPRHKGCGRLDQRPSLRHEFSQPPGGAVRINFPDQGEQRRL